MNNRQTITLTLKHAIEFGKETITQLHFREGRLSDLKGVRVGGDGVDIESMMKVAGNMCGQPTGVIDRLHPDDSGEVLAIAMAFFGRCLKTGTEPSPSSE